MPADYDGADDRAGVEESDRYSLQSSEAEPVSLARILSDGECIHGICYRSRDRDGGVVTFKPAAQWEFSLRGRPLFRVQGGLVQLPLGSLTEQEFTAKYLTVFKGAQPDELARIWRIAEAVMKTGKGAVLVISEDAVGEAARLGESSFSTTSVPLDSSDVDALVRMDGAVLVDRAALLHATGVVLDGTQVAGGLRSRGARLNATQRYVYARDENRRCVALVVSEDGPYSVVVKPQTGSAQD